MMHNTYIQCSSMNPLFNKSIIPTRSSGPERISSHPSRQAGTAVPAPPNQQPPAPPAFLGETFWKPWGFLTSWPCRVFASCIGDHQGYKGWWDIKIAGWVQSVVFFLKHVAEVGIVYMAIFFFNGTYFSVWAGDIKVDAKIVAQVIFEWFSHDALFEGW